MNARSLPALALAVLVLSSAAGCGTTPRLQAMIPDGEGLVFESTGKSLSVGSIQGGPGAGSFEEFMLGSRINAHDFRLALIEAFRQSSLFTEVTAELALESPADYRLTGTLMDQRQPVIGFGLTVGLTMRYVLVDNATGEEMLDEVVTSSYTAGMGESLIAAVRLRKANEGAVRENIENLVRRLSAASFE